MHPREADLIAIEQHRSAEYGTLGLGIGLMWLSTSFVAGVVLVGLFLGRHWVG